MGIVTQIKKHHQIKVANAVYAEGYSWRNPKWRPTNIESMLSGVPRITLVRILSRLESHA